jgi:hypothetical protein
MCSARFALAQRERRQTCQGVRLAIADAMRRHDFAEASRAHAALTREGLLPRFASRFFDIARLCVMWRVDGHTAKACSALRKSKLTWV